MKRDIMMYFEATLSSLYYTCSDSVTAVNIIMEYDADFTNKDMR